ncbi:autotransporter outer membrane beta-barrel domain-containing protein [Paraburkholderia tropica]|uniref:hypothetical protein n=1 Tax=Paraburkholderia tropica TaxID=92647 RepID=UPI002AB778D9|nr:hypothetical protein [Paraburkholderia tropica]
MTALQTVNLGTAPTGTDGDTVRVANVKANANVAVLNTQATLTSSSPNAVRDLTAADMGKRVNFTPTAASTVRFPAANTTGADQLVAVHNLATAYDITMAIATGSGDTAPTMVVVKPGEMLTWETDGVSVWRTIGRKKALDETVQGKLTVAGDAVVSGNATFSKNATVTGDATVSGKATVTGTLTLSGGLASALPVASGGTGGATASDARGNLGLGTSGSSSRRNLLTNARFLANTRNVASGTTGITASGGKPYFLDRWYIVTSGQAPTWDTNAFARTVTCPAAGIGQIIPPEDMAGDTYTLSWTGTATATVNGTAVANGGTIALTEGVSATVIFLNGTVRFPQLERGTAKTATEIVPLHEEYRRCAFFARWVKIDREGYQSASQNEIWTINFDRMRSTPVNTSLDASPSYGGVISAPPTFNIGIDSVACTAAMSGTTGTWYAVGYRMLLTCEL